MSEISKEKKEEIIKKLAEKGVRANCPMCGNNNFVLADGFFTNFLQSDLTSINIGGSNVPTIPVVCSNCGFVSQHAVGVLGMLPEGKEETEREKKDENK